MIDCGHNVTTGWKPGDYLRSLGVTSLKMLVITNYDEDHVSGLPNLIDRVHIQNLLRNPTVSAQSLKTLKSECGLGPGVEKLMSLMNGFGEWLGPPQFPGVNWNAFWNNYPVFDDENNLSLVLHLRVSNVTFLFPGDLEKQGWKALLQALPDFRAAVQTVGVLVASHHGRESGRFPELFDIYGCRPRIVVISDDYHQFDTQQTTIYYKSKCIGIDYFRTQGRRWVLTTRGDGTLSFMFPPQGGCIVT